MNFELLEKVGMQEKSEKETGAASLSLCGG
jgi:hypothetical protein